MKEIEVEEKGHADGQLNESNRVVSWQLKINPNEERREQIKYTVRYPKDRQIQLD